MTGSGKLESRASKHLRLRASRCLRTQMWGTLSFWYLCILTTRQMCSDKALGRMDNDDGFAFHVVSWLCVGMIDHLLVV